MPKQPLTKDTAALRLEMRASALSAIKIRVLLIREMCEKHGN